MLLYYLNKTNKGVNTKEIYINGIEIKYFFETDKQSIKKYYQMKNKQGLSFTPEEKLLFVEQVVSGIKENYNLNNYDLILIPETNNECFKEIIQQLNIKAVMFNKNSKEKILMDLAQQKMRKAERKKLVDSIECMNDVKIGLIAANQRMRVANLLFNIQEDLTAKKVLFMDDSIFTGSTFKAISELVKIEQACVLFSNKD